MLGCVRMCVGMWDVLGYARMCVGMCSGIVCGWNCCSGLVSGWDCCSGGICRFQCLMLSLSLCVFLVLVSRNLPRFVRPHDSDF